MEIKTTYEIMNFHDVKHDDNTKWVRVDDVTRLIKAFRLCKHKAETKAGQNFREAVNLTLDAMLLELK